MDRSLGQFVRTLYFEIQTVEDVKSLEIWNGIRQKVDPFETASLAKNLLKIAVPLVNEACTGRPFHVHARRTKQTLAALMTWFRGDPEGRLIEQFPDPPTGDDGQKQLYRAVRDAAKGMLEGIDAKAAYARPSGVAEARPGSNRAMLPDGLFDFREMRIVDNELPFIIFTEKEFRVIHGLVIVYMWIIDADGIFLDCLARNGVTGELIGAYREFAHKVQAENPLTIKGKEMTPRALLGRIRDKLAEEDYLDIFDDVHRWFEQTRARFTS
jgi:hypothetical protein